MTHPARPRRPGLTRRGARKLYERAKRRETAVMLIIAVGIALALVASDLLELSRSKRG